MVKRRKLWTKDNFETALEAHAEEQIYPNPRVQQHPENTLRRKIRRLAADIPDRKPEPAPVLGKAVDDDICISALCMQRDGYPVSRDMLIANVKEVYATMSGKTRASGTGGR